MPAQSQPPNGLGGVRSVEHQVVERRHSRLVGILVFLTDVRWAVTAINSPRRCDGRNIHRLERPSAVETHELGAVRVQYVCSPVPFLSLGGQDHDHETPLADILGIGSNV